MSTRLEGPIEVRSAEIVDRKIDDLFRHAFLLTRWTGNYKSRLCYEMLHLPDGASMTAVRYVDDKRETSFRKYKGQMRCR